MNNGHGPNENARSTGGEERLAELREQEARYRALFEHTNDAVFILDLHGTHLMVNRQATDLLGYTVDEMIGMSVEQIVAPGDYENSQERLASLLDGRDLPVYERAFRCKDGSEVIVEINAALVRDAEGNPIHIQSIVRDITERKRTEKALTRERDLLHALLDNIPDSIYFKDVDSRFTRINQAQARLLSLSHPAEAVGKTDFDFFLEDHAQNAYADEQEIVRTRQPLIDKIEKIMEGDGRLRWVSTTKVPILDQEQQVVGLVGITRDITKRKKAEGEREQLLGDLMLRGNQLLTAAEVSKSASTILDPEDLINEAVHVIQTRFGFYYVGLFLTDDADEYAVLQAGTGDAGRRMLEAGHKLAVGGDSMIGQCVGNAEARIALDVGQEAVRFDNPALPETRSEMALPLVSRGQCIGALTVQSAQEAAFTAGDIASLQAMADQLAIAISNARLYDEVQRHATRLEERVAERTAELAAVNQELEAFAYSVSHDLRAPLRSIDGFSQALLEDYEGELDAVGQDYLRRVRAASQRMGRLIDDLLRLSRLTRRKMHREAVDLSAIAWAIVAELAQNEPERQVEFAIADDIIAVGDTQLLQVAVENLLGNAWKFTSKQPRARIEFGTMDLHNETVYFVRDDGAGFDMTYADKLFGAFQRVHPTTEFEGTGIGLATVQRIIHRHGGRIWAEGAVEQGATFYFTLAPTGGET